MPHPSSDRFAARATRSGDMLVKGAVRDFFVRLVVTADEPPEVVFAPL